MDANKARAQKEATAAATRRATAAGRDLHAEEQQRALQRYLAAELRETTASAPPQREVDDSKKVDRVVAKRRRTRAAERMRKQARGADEVPRGPRPDV